MVVVVVARVVVVEIVVVVVVATSVVVVEIPAAEAGGLSMGVTSASGRDGGETRAGAGAGGTSGATAGGDAGLPPPQDTANRTATNHNSNQILRLIEFSPFNKRLLTTIEASLVDVRNRRPQRPLMIANQARVRTQIQSHHSVR